MVFALRCKVGQRRRIGCCSMEFAKLHRCGSMGSPFLFLRPMRIRRRKAGSFYKCRPRPKSRSRCPPRPGCRFNGTRRTPPCCNGPAVPVSTFWSVPLRWAQTLPGNASRRRPACKALGSVGRMIIRKRRFSDSPRRRWRHRLAHHAFAITATKSKGRNARGLRRRSSGGHSLTITKKLKTRSS